MLAFVVHVFDALLQLEFFGNRGAQLRTEIKFFLCFQWVSTIPIYSIVQYARFLFARQTHLKKQGKPILFILVQNQKSSQKRQVVTRRDSSPRFALVVKDRLCGTVSRLTWWWYMPLRLASVGGPMRYVRSRTAPPMQAMHRKSPTTYFS